MTQHLFVYGSLIPQLTSAFGKAERTRLARESTVIGPASVRGKLYDLGDYPGLISNSCLHTRVDGVLLRLNMPDETFAWLDPFEDIVPGRPLEVNQYERVTRTVTTADGGEIAAWVYVMWRVPASASEITTGRWLPSSL